MGTVGSKGPQLSWLAMWKERNDERPHIDIHMLHIATHISVFYLTWSWGCNLILHILPFNHLHVVSPVSMGLASWYCNHSAAIWKASRGTMRHALLTTSPCCALKAVTHQHTQKIVKTTYSTNPKPIAQQYLQLKKRLKSSSLSKSTREYSLLGLSFLDGNPV